MPELIAHLQTSGTLRSPALIEALRRVDRGDFVPEELRPQAYDDVPLPIGAGQTISQPYTVVFMLEKLQVKAGHRVLEIGFGSGWQTVLLAHLAGEHGSVHAFEVVPQLCAFGTRNIEKYPDLAKRVSLHCKSAEHGFAAAAPFDRIICAAEVEEAPPAWREQLAPRGRMIYPQKGGLTLEERTEDGPFISRRFEGFVFVPYR